MLNMIIGNILSSIKSVFADTFGVHSKSYYTNDFESKSILTKEPEEAYFEECKDEENLLSFDGKISNSNQGRKGDCYFLATVNSIASQNPDFFKNIIKETADTVTVTFKGIGNYNPKTQKQENLSYTFYKDQLQFLDQSFGGMYSYGDDDVLALEVANRYLRRDIKDGNVKILSSYYQDFKEVDDNGKKVDIDRGGYPDEVFTYLTGKTAKSHAKYKSDIGNLKEFLTSNSKKMICCSFNDNNEELNKFGLCDHHAYSLTLFDGDYVTLLNPWDSSKPIKISINDLKDLHISFCIGDMEDGDKMIAGSCVEGYNNHQIIDLSSEKDNMGFYKKNESEEEYKKRKELYNEAKSENFVKNKQKQNIFSKIWSKIFG